MLDVAHLECVRGERVLFSGLNFRLDPGELLYLQGKNGSGKTSLLRILCGFSRPVTGVVGWRGESIEQLGEAYRRELFYLGHHNAIKEELTPLENLRISAGLGETAFDEGVALEALERLGLAGREDLPCRYLSQGQKRRVALARLVGTQRPLWLLDEPYVTLDAAAIDLVASLIGVHLQRGGLAVLTTHQAVALTAGVVKELVLDAPPGRRRS